MRQSSIGKADIEMKEMSEEKYIKKRKRKAFRESILYELFRVLPIKKRKIAVCTFEGRSGFGCNPKYIVEELHKRNAAYEFVWLVNEEGKEFPDYITPIKNTLWNRAYHLSTAHVWIDNYRKPLGTKKRKHQLYIQTWHGAIGFKTIGLWRGAAFSRMAYLVSKNDSDMTDYVVIDSEFCRQLFPKGLVYQGGFLKFGNPRCDILCEDREAVKKTFRKKYDLEEQTRLLMFAPTFREGNKDGVRSVFSETWSIDFERLLSVLKRKFGGEWKICLRVHPQLAAQMKKELQQWERESVIDVSQNDDMYELLAAMDILITDYSSVAMDAGFANIPVFIYADDIEDYIEKRGSLLWNMTTEYGAVIKNNREMTPEIDAVLPYSISKNNDELEKSIMNFDIEKYQTDISTLKEEVQLVFDGKASSRTADKIEDFILYSDKG